MTNITTSYERKDTVRFFCVSDGDLFMIEQEDKTTKHLRPVFYKRIPNGFGYGHDYNAVRLSEKYDCNDPIVIWVKPETPVHPVMSMDCKFILA